MSRKLKSPTRLQLARRAASLKLSIANPRLHNVTHIVASCKRLGIPCDRELLLSIHCPDTCPVLGTPIWFERGRGRRPAQSTASFDRIDPAGGYVAGNVVIKSMRANQMKSNASPEEEFLYAQYVMAEHAHRLGP